VLGASAVTVTAIATPAFAYWSGGGTAAGSTTLATTFSVSATGTATGLFPGGSVDVILTVDRTGLPALTVQSVTRDAGLPILVSGAPGCTNPDVTIAFSQPVVMAAGVSTTVHLTDAASMGTASQNACQGGTFRIPVTLTAVQ
jgi:hypothetical protein